MDNLEINKLIELLGDYKKCGNEYLFQCPYCMDKSKNNFSYNTKKNFLWCFASNGEHSKKWLSEVYNKRFQSKPLEAVNKQPRSPRQLFNMSIEKIERNLSYTMFYNNTLLNSPDYLDIILSKRGLTKKTIKDCYIGISTKQKKFVFPSIRYYTNNSHLEIVNFEYRSLDLTKNGLYKQKGGLNGLMQINQYTRFTENLIILGGYIDCYSFYQYLCCKNAEKSYHITTSSNGEPMTLKYLIDNEYAFSKYKNHYLCLDNDYIGMKTTQKIIKQYPFFKIINLPQYVKDFNEFINYYNKIPLNIL